MKRKPSYAALEIAANARILVIDGAMGTMIQRHKPDEAAYRGERFKDWHRDVKGNNELLSLTQPQIIHDIHDQYFAAGVTSPRPIPLARKKSRRPTTAWKPYHTK